MVTHHLFGELLNFLGLGFALRHLGDFDFVFRAAAHHRGDLLVSRAGVLRVALLSGELLALAGLQLLAGLHLLTGLQLSLLTLLKLILLAGLTLLTLTWLSLLSLLGLSLLSRLRLPRLPCRRILGKHKSAHTHQ